MGRCGGWSRGVALALAVVAASCGGTGGGPSDSGNPLVFQARGRLNLIVQPTNDPRVLTLIATLLDPQGVPFRNQAITFTAEFADATFIPGSDNQGAARTNDVGQAKITLIAGLTTGHMRIIAEAPPALNILTGITVELTAQGFLSLGALGIIPSAVTFVNPLVSPDIPRECPNTLQENPDATFNAVGGTPPYRWDNSNKDLGRICPTGLPNINQTADYTLVGPIPTEVPGVLEDTIFLKDATEDPPQTADVLVIFAECTLIVSTDTITFTNAVGGETAQITVTNGVPPFTITQTRPEAGDASINDAGVVTFTVATPPVPVESNTLLIRDSQGCIASANVTVTVGDPVITPESVTLSPGQRQQFVVTGGVPPYQITPNGGTVDTETITESGGSFIYTAGLAEGTFSIVVTDARNSVIEAMVTIEVATLQVQPDELLVCNFIGRTVRITILSGVPPFTATHTFNVAGTLICEEPNGETGDIVTCQGNRILYLVTTEGSFDPDSVIIRDSQGGVATVSIAINGEDCPEIELCGNGVLEGFEQCEIEEEFGGLTCEDFAGPGATGTLLCNNDCTIDSSSCQVSNLCGNGVLEGFEQCETGGEFGGLTCENFGGELSQPLFCNDDCTIDSDNCQAPAAP